MCIRMTIKLIFISVIFSCVLPTYAQEEPCPPVNLGSGNANSGNAISPGFYIGLGAGPATNSGQIVNANTPDGGTTPATPTSTQAAIRLYLGYKFAYWVAAELGGTYFSTINYHTNVPSCGRTKVGFGTIDVSIKAGIPIYIFSVYAIGGAAANYVVNTSGLNQDGTCDKSFNQWTFGALYGVGASLSLTQNTALDVSYTRIHIGAMVNNMNFLAIGFSYHFVDTFCGQFLCDY